MKLLAKYNRVNAVATILILLLSGVCYYFFIRTVLIHQLDKDLTVEEKELTDFVKENNALPEPSNYRDEQEAFLLENNSIKRKFSSVEVFSTRSSENVSYRQLEFPVQVAGKQYKIQIKKSQEETEDLISLILLITLGVVLILLLTLFIVNRFILGKLWKPFKNTLQQLKQFNLSGKDKIHLEKSDITEFTELNDAVQLMTTRVTRDYSEVKDFTENASHEIQTPLAIIKSKLELLSQAENLQEEQMNTIQSVSDAVNRLSKLNQSLILLTKIDNRQFMESNEVNLSNLILKHLNNYEELAEAKMITISKNIDADVKIMINDILADILVSNLLINSIKHNIPNGKIEISLTKNKFSVCNTGPPLQNDPSELFERFKKDRVTSESLGLGLSIVKKICEKYGYGIFYRYDPPHHLTTIDFLPDHS